MYNNLKCDATQCLYNANRLCAADRIEVHGEDTMGGRFTFCGTFESKSLKNYATGLGNMNITSAVKGLFADNGNMGPEVACNAVNCVYNNEKLCNADDVKIIGEISSEKVQTECETFFPNQY